MSHTFNVSLPLLENTFIIKPIDLVYFRHELFQAVLGLDFVSLAHHRCLRGHSNNTRHSKVGGGGGVRQSVTHTFFDFLNTVSNAFLK